MPSSRPSTSSQSDENNASSSLNQNPNERNSSDEGDVAMADVDVVEEEVGEANVADQEVDPGAPLEAEVDDNFYGFEDQEPNYETNDMTQVLSIWESKHTNPGFDPVPALKRLAEIFESETDIYMRKDPDPFDERHPYRTDPSCQFGSLLKQLFRKDHFMNKLVNDYLRDNYFTRQNIQKSSLELNVIACRLILVIMPGLETSAVFQAEYDNLINRIHSWAEDSIEPLQSYAAGLLAAAMEVTDIAVKFRDQSTRLIPKMIKRLHMLQAFHKNINEKKFIETNETPTTNRAPIERIVPSWLVDSAPVSPQHSDDESSTNKRTADNLNEISNVSNVMEGSRDEFSSGSTMKNSKRNYIPIHPSTPETSQMLMIRYLTSMGEYQEFLGLVFENKAMQLIFGYIENLDRRNTCLAFEALKYLASLLCHKKFALEFITHGGLELLLKVPRPSIAATGVSITLYYLAYSEDAMERICTMPRKIISELVHYALWILGRSYDSGKCHATMFFGLSFQFKVILDEFDNQDGLRKLFNVISVLKILNPSGNVDEESVALNDDVECASRQLVRHVCVALKRYMESHLFYKFNNFMRLQGLSSDSPNSITKATKSTLEQITEQVRTLQENTPVRAHWSPVDQLLKLGGVTLLLKIIALSYDWNNGGRAETVRSALDVLSICCVIPKVYLAFCDRLEMPDNLSSSGIYAILGAAVGDITTDAEVQKSALSVLCHCVCAPITRKDPGAIMKSFSSSKKKPNNKYSEELVEKVWESVCSNNGIIVLLQLMQIKVPITDADCIRGMACRALAGLSRSERVRQIVGKLPLFANGQIQHLMRDPILQEKRAEHVVFQKYALELLERVSGKTKPFNNQLDPSLANIHKANVVAQTKILYNEQQLYQLIYDHLSSKGLTLTAQTLQKEAGLAMTPQHTKNFHQSPIDYKVQAVNIVNRNRLRTRAQEAISGINGWDNGAINGNFMHDESTTTTTTATSLAAQSIVTPIKLVKKSSNTSSTSSTSNIITSSSTGASSTSVSSGSCQRSLQKQISAASNNFGSGGTSSMLALNQVETTQPTSLITLNTIVTEYLTNQHALCKNPMTTCPQFDLFTPHKCPDPIPSRLMGTNLNITTRWFKSQAGYNTSRLDRRYVHSNFAPWRIIRSNDYNDIQFTCCDILPSCNLIVVGTQQGEAKAFSLNEGTEQFSSICHSYLIDSIQSNKRGNLVLTSCSWRSPLSVLWSIERNEFTSSLRFNDEFYCEFCNVGQDKILGTQTDSAIIYDINTGSKLSTFTPTIANQYTKNRATFCPTDELILSDGVLWDVRSGKEVHKFDKLNQTLSGIFHPNNLEIISNTEVWDLRTFHLLQTVPVLDQCLVKFSPMKVLYGISLDNDNRVDFDDTSSYDTSFKVLDSYDYSSISTVDVKRHIYDISINGNGSLIALVENQPAYDSKQETFIKIYAVGMKKNEQQEEEDDEGPESEEGSDSDSTRIYDFSDNDIQIRRRRRRLQNNENGGEEEEEGPDSEEGSDSDDDDDNGGWVSLTDSNDDGGDDDANDGANGGGDGGGRSGDLMEFLVRIG